MIWLVHRWRFNWYLRLCHHMQPMNLQRFRCKCGKKLYAKFTCQFVKFNVNDPRRFVARKTSESLHEALRHTLRTDQQTSALPKGARTVWAQSRLSAPAKKHRHCRYALRLQTCTKIPMQSQKRTAMHIVSKEVRAECRCVILEMCPFNKQGLAYSALKSFDFNSCITCEKGYVFFCLFVLPWLFSLSSFLIRNIQMKHNAG